jgi:phenylalanyl-tRNA synthetase alpha chain
VSTGSTDLGSALERARRQIAEAGSTDALARLDRELLGRGSPAQLANERIKHLPADERPAAGRALGEYRKAVTALLEQRRAVLATAESASGFERERLDLTLGPRDYGRGTLHPVTQVWRELEDIFVGLGYTVEGGPEVEHDWYNFEALNFPPGHPARAMQDTLYVRLGAPEEVLLRTHTSPVQVRTMERRSPPIAIVAPGRVYRRDTLDARHSPVFHQIEGLVVDHGITLGDLLGTIETFVHALFGENIESRFLPSFFPFTEPSVEFAATCIFCEGQGCGVCSRTGWIELGGAGMVDPNVFLAVGIDPEEYTGFAFGFGIDRLVQLRHGVEHVKALWDNDVRFLRQF